MYTEWGMPNVWRVTMFASSLVVPRGIPPDRPNTTE
jgi:hypothetical protein